MNRGKSPPINLDKYLVGKEHRYCTYNDGASRSCTSGVVTVFSFFEKCVDR